MSTREGKYMYCIIECDGAKNFGAIGVGGRGDELTTVSYQSLSAVVCHSPVIEYRVTRENTMTHQSAIETVMKEYPVLP
ncbi:MAG: GvpL/GvpF family gas vesicle protein, partial [Candidatus Omnitrophica bacterium]|nr:GvpL/GvpF family gas vesicle protein [Candidatus Omnitrophota bacterium]